MRQISPSGQRIGCRQQAHRPMPLQVCVEGVKNECALAGPRVRSRGPVSAHSQPRKCALAEANIHTLLLTMHERHKNIMPARPRK